MRAASSGHHALRCEILLLFLPKGIHRWVFLTNKMGQEFTLWLVLPLPLLNLIPTTVAGKSTVDLSISPTDEF